MNAPTATIAAMSTPPGRGALAVVRLTGDGAHKTFVGIISEKEKFIKETPRRIGVYTVVDTIHADHTAIDEVIAVKYSAPSSYTGEDMVEIFSHGGTIIPEKILEQLFNCGAQSAGRGEFSRRALINGKIGILKAESIRELIESQTETHLRSAQLAYFGKQSESIERLKQEIIVVLSDIESRIEFDEDDDVAESKQRQVSANKTELTSITTRLEDERQRGDRIKALDDGIIVTIAGPANAGKSSLFNEILGYDRSIVHDRPGTTRDIVSERLRIDGVTVKLFDSAGIRETGDAVERLGMDRTRSAVAEAHAVLWVTSAAEVFGVDERKEILRAAGIGGEGDNCAQEDSHEAQHVDIYDDYGKNREKDGLVVIINKIDVDESLAKDGAIPSFKLKSYLTEKKQFCEEHGLKYVETSITQKLNQAQLFEEISATVKGAMKDVPTPAIIINERHRGIVEAVIGDLRECLDNIDREEVAAHSLRSALDRLSEFSGHIGSDEVLNRIFERFCIGK
jgi:tRNA modification GTPase